MSKAKHPEPTNGHAGEYLPAVPIGQIRPWPGNPRKTFSETGLKDLAESIRGKGVLQPLLVRRRPRKATAQEDLVKFGLLAKADDTPKDTYEIADGERRYRAAQLAGVKDLPVRVLALSDADMLEIAVVSCEQREDVPVLERAAGYARLVNEHQVTVEDLAARIGRSPSTIRDLLRLQRSLPALAREALEAGYISPSVAGLIARVPDAAARLELTCRVIIGAEYGQAPSEREVRKCLKQDEVNDAGVQAMSARDTREVIARLYMTELKGSPFSRKSLDLVPDAGSCEECPKRAGNDPELVAEGVRADVCTDPGCYRRKLQSHNDQVRERAKSQGQKILDSKEAEKLFGYNSDHLSYDAPFVELSAKCPDDPKGRTYQKLLGQDLAGDIVVAQRSTGTLHPLLPREKVKAALKAQGIKTPGGASNGKEDDWKQVRAKKQAAARREAEIGKEAARRANGIVAETFGRLLGGAVGIGPKFLAPLRALADAAAEMAWSDTCRQVARRRGLDTKPGPKEAIATLVAGTTEPRELLALIAELIVARESLEWAGYYAGPEKKQKALWTAFGVDRAKILKEIEAEKNGKPRNGRAPKPKPDEEPEEEEPGRCRICGCSEQDCRLCVKRTGEPCTWVDETATLCSACLPIVNAELTTLPDLEDLTALIEASPYGHVGDVAGKTPDLLLDFAAGLGARHQLYNAVERWIGDQLGRTDDGTEMMPKEEEVPAPRTKARK